MVERFSPGLINRLLIEKTQNGGYHVVWRCGVIEGNQKLAKRLPTREELKKDPNSREVSSIETRGKGGQFMVAPSPGYSLIQGDWRKLPTITPEEREILLDCARSLARTAKTNRVSPSAPTDGERPGDLFNREGQDEALELLQEGGWEIVFERNGTKYLRRPGKNRGISATFGHVAPGVFYNFTSNGSPFDVDTAYSPFAVYALLKHGGDFKAAARQLKTPILEHAPSNDFGNGQVDLKGWLAGQAEYGCKDIVDHVLTLDSMEYEGTRGEVASKLNYRLSKLDEWYEKRNSTKASEAMLDPTSPWPEPVTLSEIANEIFANLQRYVVMPEECTVAVTMWVCASWIYDRFDIFPYLLLSSPTKRCGKTRLLGILRHLVKKGLQAASISPAALFRVVELERPTLLLDEFDQQANVDDFLNLLNSGHERSGAAIRLIPKDKDFVPRSFSTFCPKIIAMIGKPKDTLVDRSIVVAMQRKKPQDALERITPDVTRTLRVHQQKLARWSADVGELPDVEPLNTTNDREADNWLPLLTVAEMAGGDWVKRARDAAKVLSKDVEDDSVKIQLLQDIRQSFKEAEADKLTTSELLDKMKLFEESPWNDWNSGKGLNARGLAILLKPFGVQSKNIRINDKVLKGYARQDFDTVFDRYIPLGTPNLRATSATTLNPLDLPPLQNTIPGEEVAAGSINKNKHVADVADKIGGIQGHMPFDDEEVTF